MDKPEKLTNPLDRRFGYWNEVPLPAGWGTESGKSTPRDDHSTGAPGFNGSHGVSQGRKRSGANISQPRFRV